MKKPRHFKNIFKCTYLHAFASTATACGILSFTSSCLSSCRKPEMTPASSPPQPTSKVDSSSKVITHDESQPRLSPRFSAILQMADVRGTDKSDYVDKCERLSAAVSLLTAQEQSELYQAIARDITPEIETELPTWQPVHAKWTLIGYILAETTERKLIVDILLNTPPPMVKGASLAEFLEHLDPSILEEVVLRGAE